VSLYLAVPLFACASSAVLAAIIWIRDPGDRASRLGALLVSGATLWSFCEVLWNPQDDAGVVMALVKASALGWVWIGPLALHLLHEATGDRSPAVRRVLPVLYGASLGFLLVDWLTPYLHRRVFPTAWGWAYDFGWAYPFFYVFTVSCIAWGLVLGWRALRHSATPAEREQARWLTAAIFVPMVVASLTDGLLPLAGFHPPRIGTASFAVLGAMIFWSFHRYGYSLLAPGTFAREILETLPDGVALLRNDGSVRTANSALARLLEAEGGRVEGLVLDDRFSELPDAPGDAALREVQCELRTVRARRVPVSLSTAVLRDKRGSPIGRVVVMRDQREMVALRNRLLLSGRLAAVGELAAGIAHEINNPLAFVRSNLGLLHEHWQAMAKELAEREDGSADRAGIGEGEELIEESLDGVDRAVAIIRDVKGLSHAGRGEREVADLHALLDGALRMAAPQLRGRVHIEKRYGEDVPGITCAPQELQQVFLNLVLNAGQAVGEAGRITVSTERRGPNVVVSVEDDGCGIEPEHLERIFDPFFTTKRMGEGTGLGLGIAYEIVRRHRGDILVESEAGRGACLRVRLPVDADTLPAS